MVNMIQIYMDLEELSQAAARLFVGLADQAFSSRGHFSVALSGGNTPRRLYEILATPPLLGLVRWEAVHVFWGDERCVAPNDPRSNALMANQALLDHVPVARDHIHPIQGNLPSHQAAAQYEAELRDFFSSQPPFMDLVLLGLGDNAHTASLFPHTLVLNEKERWAAEVYIDEQDMYRVTLTAPFINQAAQVIFLVSGAEKAHPLQQVLEGPYQPDELPAQLIHPNGAQPIWLVDKAASHKLTVSLETALDLN
jgi:6-phosphogluconolactonase